MGRSQFGYSNNTKSELKKRGKPTTKTMTASVEERLATTKAFIENDIANNKVVVYAKTWIRDLDIMDDPSGPCLAKALTNYSGQTSVPNIFINGEHFGGNSDLQEAHTNGSLKL